MTEYEVGYGKPPKHSQFKKGTSPNPNGRRGRQKPEFAQIFTSVLYAHATFRENGCAKKAPRLEIEIKRLGAAAIRGDIESADKLMKMSSHATSEGETAPLIIHITGGLTTGGTQPLPPDLYDDS